MALKEEAEVTVTVDNPYIIEIVPSFKVKAGSLQPIIIPLHTKHSAGHCVLSFHSTSKELDNLFRIRIKVKVVHHIYFEYLSICTGWGFFLIWAISCYPQLFENYYRKSVVGLSFDFLALSFTGHICLGIFNMSLYYNTHIQVRLCYSIEI